MLFLISLLSVFFIQLSSAQILNLGQAQRTVNIPGNTVVLANNGISGVNSLPLNNVQLSNVQAVRNVPNTIIANNNFGNGIANFGSNTIAVPNYGNNLASTNLVSNNLAGNFVSRGSVNANLPINLANGFNINTGTFAVSNNGLANLLPYGRQCGIQISADALEVAGAVGVNGQMPFYTTVNVNGKLPTSGSGVVNCGCGK